MIPVNSRLIPFLTTSFDSIDREKLESKESDESATGTVPDAMECDNVIPREVEKDFYINAEAYRLSRLVQESPGKVKIFFKGKDERQIQAILNAVQQRQEITVQNQADFLSWAIQHGSLADIQFILDLNGADKQSLFSALKKKDEIKELQLKLDSNGVDLQVLAIIYKRFNRIKKLTQLLNSGREEPQAFFDALIDNNDKSEIEWFKSISINAHPSLQAFFTVLIEENEIADPKSLLESNYNCLQNFFYLLRGKIEQNLFLQINLDHKKLQGFFNALKDKSEVEKLQTLLNLNRADLIIFFNALKKEAKTEELQSILSSLDSNPTDLLIMFNALKGSKNLIENFNKQELGGDYIEINTRAIFLDWKVRHGSLEEVQTFLAENKEHIKAIFQAAQENNEEKNTILHIASFRSGESEETIEIIKKLIEAGAEIDAVNAKGQTAINHVIKYNLINDSMRSKLGVLVNNYDGAKIASYFLINHTDEVIRLINEEHNYKMEQLNLIPAISSITKKECNNSTELFQKLADQGAGITPGDKFVFPLNKRQQLNKCLSLILDHSIKLKYKTRLEIAKKLISNEASPHEASQRKLTLLDYSIIYGDFKTFDELSTMGVSFRVSLAARKIMLGILEAKNPDYLKIHKKTYFMTDGKAKKLFTKALALESAEIMKLIESNRYSPEDINRLNFIIKIFKTDLCEEDFNQFEEEFSDLIKSKQNQPVPSPALQQ